jgi:hypothetical protein
VLWALSTCANEWQSAEKLTRLCTIPEPVLSGAWDKTRYAMEARIRADAYMKIRQWNVAPTSLRVGGSVLLMNVDQFRAIHPEYQSASDHAQ